MADPVQKQKKNIFVSDVIFQDTIVHDVGKGIVLVLSKTLIYAVP